MPPNTRTSALSTSITLTSTDGSSDTRVLTIKPGDPCLIGRASRSSLKNLEARRDNALFDCPVVSREHAEIKVNLWDLIEDQVTITDKGSMHGTRVNGEKLREGSAKTLRTGDVIQFGERVTRGDSAHEGVEVVFAHRRDFTQDSNTLAARTQASNPSGVYRYPYTSDEESEYDSDDQMSMLSEADDVQEISSAKTSPEQAKARLGSQDQPIELDKPDKSSRMIVQDSVDATNSILVPESVPAPRRQIDLTNVDGDSDDEGVIVQKDTTTRAPAPMPPLAVSKESAMEASEPPHAINYERDEMRSLSEGEAAEGEEEVFDQSHYDIRPAIYSPSPVPATKASPELRSSGQRPVPSPFAFQSFGVTSQPTFAESYMSTHGCATNLYNPPSASQPTSFSGYGMRNIRPTPSSGASRWDQLPASMSALPTFANTYNYDDPSERAHPTYASTLPLPHGYDTSSNTYTEPFNISAKDGQPMDDFLRVEPRIDFGRLRGDRAPGKDSLAGRISIPDIVEGPQPMANKATPYNVASESSSAVNTAGTGTKRKASDDDDDNAAPLATTSVGGLEGVANDRTTAEVYTPPSKRVKTTDTVVVTPPPTASTRTSASSFAGSVAKYAFAASAGGAGMFAFLCSPASERFLTWLS